MNILPLWFASVRFSVKSSILIPLIILELNMPNRKCAQGYPIITYCNLAQIIDKCNSQNGSQRYTSQVWENLFCIRPTNLEFVSTFIWIQCIFYPWYQSLWLDHQRVIWWINVSKMTFKKYWSEYKVDILI